jgi:hypothetical protein
MNLLNNITGNLGFSLCGPAAVYFTISMIAILVMIIFRRYFPDINCIGMYKCDRTDFNAILAIKVLYVFFWTWILNLICSRGGDLISWILVILPFVSLIMLLTPKQYNF